MGKIKDFFLEEIIDPLVVRYLGVRIIHSNYWGNFAELKLKNFIGEYTPPSEMSARSDWMRDAERMFEEKHDEIKKGAGLDDRVVIINPVTREWKYALSLAHAKEVVREMKRPEKCYFRPFNYNFDKH